jgi:glycosyltransferase involved in cell wall biosynthesis
MNILHVTAPAAFGGLERVVEALARRTAALGHQVQVAMALSPNDPVPAWSASLEAAGVRAIPLHLSSRAYLAERRAIRALGRAHGTDVMHTHGYRSDVLHLGVARRLGVPIVSTAHGFASRTPGYSRNERLQVWAWRRFDAVVAVSEPLRAQLESFRVPFERLHLIRNGIAGGSVPLARAEARRRLALPAEGGVIGWVGRLSDEKHPLLAIESFALLAAPEATLCIIGDGPLREACAVRAHELGVADRVVFAGAHPDAAPLMSAFDLLLLSSRTEGTPMVVLEAASAAVPVVSTAVGGVPALLGDAGGWLATPGDSSALAEALRAAFGDRAERLRRGAALQAAVQSRAAGDDWVERYVALYERLHRAAVAAGKRNVPVG